MTTTGGPGRTVPSLAGVASRGGQSATALDKPLKIDVHDLSFYYGDKRALDYITIQIRQNLVTAWLRSFPQLSSLHSGGRAARPSCWCSAR